jgi:hypothetical protein
VAAIEHAVHADVDLRTPVLRGGLEEELPADHAGIVDEHVDRAPLTSDALDHAPDGRLVGGVARPPADRIADAVVSAASFDVT